MSLTSIVKDSWEFVKEKSAEITAGALIIGSLYLPGCGGEQPAVPNTYEKPAAAASKSPGKKDYAEIKSEAPAIKKEEIDDSYKPLVSEDEECKEKILPPEAPKTSTGAVSSAPEKADEKPSDSYMALKPIASEEPKITSFEKKCIEAGVEGYPEAQEKRKKGDALFGWDAYPDFSSGNDLGKDRMRLTLSSSGNALTDRMSFGESFKLEMDPFREFTADNALRLYLRGSNENSSFSRKNGSDLFTRDTKLDLSLGKLMDFDEAQLMFRIGYGFNNWESNGANAPDLINAHTLNASLGLRLSELGLKALLGYSHIIDGHYKFSGVKEGLNGNEIFASVEWNIPGTDAFFGSQYKFTFSDFEKAMKTEEHGITAFAGIRNLKYVDLLGAGVSYRRRDSNLGEPEDLWLGEIRARWYPTKNLSFEINGYLGESPKESGRKFSAGAGGSINLEF